MFSALMADGAVLRFVGFHGDFKHVVATDANAMDFRSRAGCVVVSGMPRRGWRGCLCRCLWCLAHGADFIMTGQVPSQLVGPIAKAFSHQRSIRSRYLGSSAKKPFRRGASRRIASFHRAASFCSYFQFRGKRGARVCQRISSKMKWR